MSWGFVLPQPGQGTAPAGRRLLAYASICFDDAPHGRRVARENRVLGLELWSRICPTRANAAPPHPASC